MITDKAKKIMIQAAIAVVITVLLNPASVIAANFNWTNSAGGGFTDPLNWNPNGPPLSGDTALFGIDATYEVDFNSSWTNVNAALSAGTVTLDIGAGNTWELPWASGGMVVGAGATTILKSGEARVRVPRVDAGGTLRIESSAVFMPWSSSGVHFGLAVRGLCVLDGGQIRPNPDSTSASGHITLDTSDALLQIINGGRVVSNITRIGSTTSSTNNQVVATGIGSGFTDSAIQVGLNGRDNGLTLQAGATINSPTSAGGLVIGNSALTTNSFMIVEGPDTEVLVYDLRMGPFVGGGRGHSLTVTNGGRFRTARVAFTETTRMFADHSSITVTGTNSSFWSSSQFGLRASHCSITVTDGAIFTNATNYSVTLGAAVGNVSNVVRIADGATWYNTTGVLILGSGGASFNTLSISNNAALRTGSGVTIGTGAGSSGNRLHVGPGATLMTGNGVLNVSFGSASDNHVLIQGPNTTGEVYQVVLGSTGSGDTVTVNNGARVVTTREQNTPTTQVVSENASLMVAGSGTMYESRGQIVMQGSHGTIAVTDNAVLTNGIQPIYIGNVAGNVSNVVRIANDAEWYTSGHMYMVTGIGHELHIENGGLLQFGGTGSPQLRIGQNATNCLLRISGGSLSQLQSLSYLFLQNNGTLAVNGPGGNIEVSNLLLQHDGPNHLHFTVTETGVTPVKVNRGLTVDALSTLTVDATEFSQAGGGKVTLVDYSDAIPLQVIGMPIATANINITPSGSILNQNDGNKITLTVPPPRGTIITIR